MEPLLALLKAHQAELAAARDKVLVDDLGYARLDPLAQQQLNRIEAKLDRLLAKPPVKMVHG